MMRKKKKIKKHKIKKKENNEDNLEKMASMDSSVSLEGFSNLEDSYSQDYYQNMPTFNEIYQPSHKKTSESNKLIEKLNYMIHLLEEQKNEKTENVTEELILYSFFRNIYYIYSRFICTSRKVCSLIN